MKLKHDLTIQDLILEIFYDKAYNRPFVLSTSLSTAIVNHYDKNNTGTTHRWDKRDTFNGFTRIKNQITITTFRQINKNKNLPTTVNRIKFELVLPE